MNVETREVIYWPSQRIIADDKGNIVRVTRVMKDHMGLVEVQGRCFTEADDFNVLYRESSEGVWTCFYDKQVERVTDSMLLVYFRELLDAIDAAERLLINVKP